MALDKLTGNDAGTHKSECISDNCFEQTIFFFHMGAMLSEDEDEGSLSRVFSNSKQKYGKLYRSPFSRIHDTYK